MARTGRPPLQIDWDALVEAVCDAIVEGASVSSYLRARSDLPAVSTFFNYVRKHSALQDRVDAAMRAKAYQKWDAREEAIEELRSNKIDARVFRELNNAYQWDLEKLLPAFAPRRIIDQTVDVNDTARIKLADAVMKAQGRLEPPTIDGEIDGDD